MILVRIRCYKCGAVLRQIEWPPEDWSTSLTFRRCQKCDLPDPARLVDVLISSGRSVGFPIAGSVPWRRLRPLISRAQRTAKTQDYDVRVVEDRNAP